jgi:surface carbohydrate biosynthesis protein
LKKIKSRLKAFYKLYIKPTKELKKPPNVDVIIYDRNGSELLEPYLMGRTHVTFSTRGESINLYILLKSIIKFNFWNLNSFDSYITSYIKCVTPKVVITFTDNDSRFYLISKQFPNVKTIMIQNGVRGISGDVFDHLEHSDKFRVDFILSVNVSVGEKYLEYMEGEVIPIGSLKNNLCEKVNRVEEDRVLFISQWAEKPLDSSVLYFENDGTPIKYEEFFSVDRVVLDLLQKWCDRNSKQLVILGRDQETHNDEFQYYSNLLPVNSFKFLPKIDSLSNYRELDKSKIVVFVDSTLGFESIGRANRTASFAWRKLSNGRQLVRFGWPLELEQEGVFWSSEVSESNFNKIMDYLNTASNSEWKNVVEKYQKMHMEYDPGNSILSNLLKNLLLAG